jgi:arginine deiminase
MTLTYGVHSEAGKLRRVMVHKPGAAMARLTARQLRGVAV